MNNLERKDRKIAQWISRKELWLNGMATYDWRRHTEHVTVMDLLDCADSRLSEWRLEYPERKDQY